MWHGLFQDAGAWIFNLNKGVEAPALQAAKKGFDVWLGNSRGSMYSHDHLFYDLNDKEQSKKYWDFSWAEIGKYDIPAAIDHILETTSHQKLNYVGYS